MRVFVFVRRCCVAVFFTGIYKPFQKQNYFFHESLTFLEHVIVFS